MKENNQLFLHEDNQLSVLTREIHYFCVHILLSKLDELGMIEDGFEEKKRIRSKFWSSWIFTCYVMWCSKAWTTRLQFQASLAKSLDVLGVVCKLRNVKTNFFFFDPISLSIIFYT